MTPLAEWHLLGMRLIRRLARSERCFSSGERSCLFLSSGFRHVLEDVEPECPAMALCLRPLLSSTLAVFLINLFRSVSGQLDLLVNGFLVELASKYVRSGGA